MRLLSSFACKLTLFFALAMPGIAFSSSEPGQDLKKAPPSFAYKGKRLVPVDFQTYELGLSLDVAQKTIKGHSQIVFYAAEAGCPLIDSSQRVTAIKLNGIALPESAFQKVQEVPGTAGMALHFVDATVAAGSTNHIDIDFENNETTDNFDDKGGAKLGWFMSDLSDGQYLEAYAPSNFEYDAFKLNLHITVAGAQTREELFTNGSAKSLGPSEWIVEFPEFYNTSSFYLHLTNSEPQVLRFEHQGMSKIIPVTAYGADREYLDSAVESIKSSLRLNEETFGPYMHDKLLIYITAEDGGMEYAGSTMTSLRSLPHEITHSWYARGVSPADGNAGWIDEAVAVWTQKGFPTANGAPNRRPVNLASLGPYNRVTPLESYVEGAQLLSELDFIMRDRGGLRPTLSQIFKKSQGTVYRTTDFKGYLENLSGITLDEIFDRYVYGRGEVRQGQSPEPVPANDDSGHPRKYTPEELRRLL